MTYGLRVAMRTCRSSLLLVVLFVFAQPAGAQDGGVGLGIVSYGKPTGGEVTAYYGVSLTGRVWVGVQGTVGLGFQLRYSSVEGPVLFYPLSTESRVAPYVGVSQGALWSEGRNSYYLTIPLGLEIQLRKRWVLIPEGFYDLRPERAAGLRVGIVYTF